MKELVITKDVFEKGRWLQRTYVGDKYTWTESGVMWNGIKRRTSDQYTSLYTKEAKYVGSVNKFLNFDDFVAWVHNQVGYGLRYDLDSDILRCTENKVYSKETCLLVPPQLNRFLQGSNISNLGVRGVSLNKNKYKVQCSMVNEDNSGYDIKFIKYFNNIEDAKVTYSELKNKAADIWRKRLASGRYIVDQRVIDYMDKWEFKYD